MTLCLTKAAVLLIGITLLFSNHSFAQSEAKTVVVVHSEREKLAVRISAELLSLGYLPQAVEMSPPVRQDVLRRIAEEHRAIAVMRVSSEGEGVQVWVVDPNDDREIVLQEVVAPVDNEQADALVAFKSVELLRASLMTLPESRGPSPSPPPPVVVAKVPQPKTAARKKESPRLVAALQPAAVFGFGNLPPAFNIGLSLHVRIAARVGVDIAGLMPSFPMTRTVPEGTIDVSVGIVTAGFRFNLLQNNRRLIPAVSVVAGPAFLTSSGHAKQGYEGKEAAQIAAVISGSFMLSFAVNEIVALKADASCGISVPEPIFRVVKADGVVEIGSFGRPLVTVLLGVAVRLL